MTGSLKTKKLLVLHKEKIEKKEKEKRKNDNFKKQKKSCHKDHSIQKSSS